MPLNQFLPLYGPKVYNWDSTFVIPNPSIDMGSGIPSTGYASEVAGVHQYSLPARNLRGTTRYRTFFNFSHLTQNQFVKSEGYGSGKVGKWWNHNNSLGDTTLKYNIGTQVNDLGINGSAQIRPYPYSFPGDPYGLAFVPTCDGMCLEGSGISCDHLGFFQVPGTAMIVSDGGGTQSGIFSALDWTPTRLNDIFMSQCYRGLVLNTGDAFLDYFYGQGFVTEGITVNGPGCKLHKCHPFGADKACLIHTSCELTACYNEAARIGTSIESYNNVATNNVVINGLNIGPGTCWYRGVSVSGANHRIHDVVGYTTSSSTDCAGIELYQGTSQCSITGTMDAFGSSRVLKIQGDRHKVNLFGDAVGPDSRMVEVTGLLNRTEITVHCYLDFSAVAIDLSEWSGFGLVIKLWWDGSAGTTPIRYPGGGTNYNLASGNEVWINNIKQVAP